jgi:hypothetical protein
VNPAVQPEQPESAPTFRRRVPSILTNLLHETWPRKYTIHHKQRTAKTHTWDIAGALNAGYQAAFVARPDVVVIDLREVAEQIRALDQ